MPAPHLLFSAKPSTPLFDCNNIIHCVRKLTEYGTNGTPLKLFLTQKEAIYRVFYLPPILGSFKAPYWMFFYLYSIWILSLVAFLHPLTVYSMLNVPHWLLFCLDILTSQLSSDLMNLSVWCERNRLLISPSKNKFTIFSSRSPNLSDVPSVVINCHTIPPTEHFTVLGVKIKNSLKRNLHIMHLRNKLSHRITIVLKNDITSNKS